MELLEKEERYFEFVLRKIADILLIIFFVYTSITILRRLYIGDMSATIGNIIFAVIYLAVSGAAICRCIIVLTGRYMSVPVLHKYLSRSEVRRLFENEHFEKPAEFKGTLFENYVYISEHWLCLYHHFILRDKAAYIWERRGGMHESFKPFILNILYATGDITGFPGDDMRHFDNKWEEYEVFWHYLACNIAGSTERGCSYQINRHRLAEACRRNFPTKEAKRDYFMSKDGLKEERDLIEKLYGKTDLENFAFIKLIDQAVLILSEREKDDNYKTFQARYGKMRIYLENLRRAYIKKTLKNKKQCLSVVRMIDHGDDEELQNAIVAVNRYYQEHIYSEK